MTIRLQLLNGNSVPPGMFRYTVPETGAKFGSQHTMDGILGLVAAHYRDNNIPIPVDLRERIEDQMCQTLPEGNCQYTDGTPYKGYQSALTMENLMKGISSLAYMMKESILGNDVFVSQEEADQRALICTRCFLNMGNGVCMGCGAMKAVTDLASNVKGGRTTKYDSQLQNCGVCGCRNDAIVHVNRKVLLSNEKPETTEDRPSWCWVKNPDLNQAQANLTT